MLYNHDIFPEKNNHLSLCNTQTIMRLLTISTDKHWLTVDLYYFLLWLEIKGRDLRYFYSGVGLTVTHCYHGVSLFLALYKSCYPTAVQGLQSCSQCQQSVRLSLFIYVKIQSFWTQQKPSVAAGRWLLPK